MPEHLSAAHRAHMEWTPERLIHWGNSIGVATGALVTRLLGTRKHPEHGYRACLGLLALAKRFTRPRLEAACVVALEVGTTNSTHVRDILVNGRDQVQPTPRVTIVVASLEPRTLGAAMKEISGTLRTIIQGPGSSSAVAA